MTEEPFEFQLGRPGGVRITGIDHGGDGQGLVLVPGFGSNVLSLRTLARRLRDFRVVMFDPRGHGKSDEPDECSLDDFVDDIEAVAEHLGIGNPAVGGHSLGGLLAIAYGERHPECPGVFNIDGGFGLDAEPSLYVDLTPDERHAYEKLNAAARASAETPIQDRGDAAWVDAEVARGMKAFGVSSAAMDRYLRRNYAMSDEGTYHRRPSVSFVRRILGLLKDEGLAQYRRLRCPALVITTSGRTTNGPDVLRRMASLRVDGLARAQDQLRSEGLDITVVHIDSTHSTVILTAADELAAAITEFLFVSR